MPSSQGITITKWMYTWGVSLMKKKKGGRKMNITVQRPSTPSESLKNSLQEMNLIREGKKKGKSWRELRAELKEE